MCLFPAPLSLTEGRGALCWLCGPRRPSFQVDRVSRISCEIKRAYCLSARVFLSQGKKPNPSELLSLIMLEAQKHMAALAGAHPTCHVVAESFLMFLLEGHGCTPAFLSRKAAVSSSQLSVPLSSIFWISTLMLLFLGF